MDSTSITLLERVRKPADKEAWERFADIYRPLLRNWALKLGLQHADADDLTQNVLAHLMAKLPDFKYGERPGKFRGWLKVVLRSKFLDLKRKRGYAPLNEDQAEKKKASDEDELSFIDREYSQFVARRALEVMQAEFEPKTWQACWKSVVDGKPAAVVAEELHTTEAVVWAAKSRVLRRLRQLLVGLL